MEFDSRDENIAKMAESFETLLEFFFFAVNYRDVPILPTPVSPMICPISPTPILPTPEMFTISVCPTHSIMVDNKIKMLF